LAWASDAPFYYWATAKQIDNGLTSFDVNKLGVLVKPFSDAYHIYLLVFSTIGALYCSFFRKNDRPLSIGLFIFGFATLLLLTEVQSRYRSVLFSSIPFFTAYGIYACGQ